MLLYLVQVCVMCLLLCLYVPQTEILKSDFGGQTDSGDGSEGACERPLSEPEGDAVSSFLRKVLPELESALDGSSSSSAFDGYLLNLRGEGHQEEAALWKTLTVDLEKHKVSAFVFHPVCKYY